MDLAPGCHPGYLSWGQYEENRQRLQENAYATARIVEGVHPRRASVVAGLGGLRRLWQPDDRPVSHAPDQDRAEYVCQRDGAEHIVSVCNMFREQLDQAIGQLLIDTITPLALEVTLTVQQEMQAAWRRWTVCVKSRWSEPGMKPTWRSDATCTSTRRTGW